MNDTIVLEGLQFFGRHGAQSAERELGQRFIVDVALVADLSPAGLADDLSLAVDYVAVYRTIREVVEGEPRRLIEAVAERIAQVLLSRFPLEEIRVRVSKPSAPLGGIFERVAVEITRRR